MSSSANLKRIEQIVEQARNLPQIDVPADGWAPTKEELAVMYARLAMAYATSTVLLQQAIPILIEEIRLLHGQPRAKPLRKTR